MGNFTAGLVAGFSFCLIAMFAWAAFSQTPNGNREFANMPTVHIESGPIVDRDGYVVCVQPWPMKDALGLNHSYNPAR